MTVERSGAPEGGSVDGGACGGLFPSPPL
ncbi:hypothetical protein GA0115260_125453, partial [Streptomyces sp. MnatMP-M27]